MPGPDLNLYRGRRPEPLVRGLDYEDFLDDLVESACCSWEYSGGDPLGDEGEADLRDRLDRFFSAHNKEAQ